MPDYVLVVSWCCCCNIIFDCPTRLCLNVFSDEDTNERIDSLDRIREFARQRQKELEEQDTIVRKLFVIEKNVSLKGLIRITYLVLQMLGIFLPIRYYVPCSTTVQHSYEYTCPAYSTMNTSDTTQFVGKCKFSVCGNTTLAIIANG